MANTITTNENTRQAMELANVKNAIVNAQTTDASYTLSENAVISKFGADGKAFVNLSRFTKAVDFVTLERIYNMSLHDFKSGYKDNDGTVWTSAIKYIQTIIEMCGGHMDGGTISAYIKVYTLFFQTALPDGIDEKVFDEKVRKFSVTNLKYISRIKSGFGSMVEFIMNESPDMTTSQIQKVIKEKYSPIEIKPRNNNGGDNNGGDNNNGGDDNNGGNNGGDDNNGGNNGGEDNELKLTSMTVKELKKFLKSIPDETIIHFNIEE